MDGEAEPDYSSLERLSLPWRLTRAGDQPFLLYDSGPSADRILAFGTPSNLEWLAASPVALPEQHTDNASPPSAQPSLLGLPPRSPAPTAAA